jgi:putative SOS response-associated peptidase YedK
MDEDISLPFDLPAVARKKVSAAFDGGRITSDGGVLLLAQAERRLGIADQLARVIPDERDADRVSICCPISCVRVSSPSPADMRTRTTSTGCASIRRSSWPVAA